MENNSKFPQPVEAYYIRDNGKIIKGQAMVLKYYHTCDCSHIEEYAFFFTEEDPKEFPMKLWPYQFATSLEAAEVKAKSRRIAFDQEMRHKREELEAYEKANEL